METFLIIMLFIMGVVLIMAVRVINELFERLDAEIRHSLTIESVLSRKQIENEILENELEEIRNGN